MPLEYDIFGTLPVSYGSQGNAMTVPPGRPVARPRWARLAYSLIPVWTHVTLFTLNPSR